MAKDRIKIKIRDKKNGKVAWVYHRFAAQKIARGEAEAVEPKKPGPKKGSKKGSKKKASQKPATKADLKQQPKKASISASLVVPTQTKN